MRRAAKIDNTQAEIVSALRNAGMKAVSIAAVGKGVPDLLVGWRGKTFLLECKTRTQDGGRGLGLTEAEREFHDTWPGHLAVVTTGEEAVQAVIDGSKRSMVAN